MIPTRGYARLLAVLALALLGPMAVAGARGATAQEPTTISMWFDNTGGSETADCIIATSIEPFNEQSTTTRVEATLQANNWDAARAAIAGGAGPDVVGTPGPSFAIQLARSGQLIPLDEFAAQYGWVERFVPWALDLGRVNGELVAIPSEVETLVLYYNKTLFEENGWQPPATMAELMTLAEQIDAAGIIPFAHANAEWRPTNEWFVGEFLNHVGGQQKVYEALTGATPWTDPAFVEAIDMLTGMQQNGWFMGGLDRYYTATGDERLAAFGNGEAAMNIEGSWFMQEVNQYFGEEAGNANDWGWVPVPSASGEAGYTLGIGQTYSINRNTERPEAVAEFLDYHLSPAVQAALVTQCGLPPAPVQLNPEDLAELDPRHAELLQALNEASAAGQYGYTTWTFWPPAAEQYLIEEVEKVWAGDLTAQEYLQGHQEQFDEERADGLVPPVPPR
ncbi:MAG: extracellular solute-binding protein [Chloroflexota bacterium]|nr:extracellular solute-binding protein [Chloroflexota bacterium]